MISRTKNLLDDFISFLKNPSSISRNTNVVKQNFIEVGFYYAIFTILIGISLTFFRHYLEESEIINSTNLSKSMEEMLDNFPLMFFMTVVIAPIFEESIFRGLIGLKEVKTHLNWLVHVSSILFGLAHSTNYELTNKQNWYIPILVLPQLFLGYMLSFIRIRYGFYYCVLLHTIYNGFLVTAIFFEKLLQ